MSKHIPLISLLAGLLSGGVAFLLLYQKTSEIEQRTTPVEILTASRYIPAGSALKADMVEKRKVPESFVSSGVLRDVNEVQGLLSLVPLSAGEQILSNKFGAGEETLALSLNPGTRAYTLEVNETNGVGNLLRPGNHVDVLTKIDTPSKEVTSFVFQNLQVLAVGQKLELNKSRLGSDTPAKGDSELPQPYGTVTLAVTPEQAEILMYLEGHPLRLLLRAPGDGEIISVPPQSGMEVMAKLGRFIPKTRGIEVIRGNMKKGE